jgi:hypothetical protein
MEDTVEVEETEVVEETPVEPDHGLVESVQAGEPQVDLDYDYALARAAILLDHAGDCATMSRDIPGMLQVAAGWASLLQYLGQAPSDDDDDDEEETAGNTIGFVGGRRANDE